MLIYVDPSRVDRLINDAVRTLPHDILSLIASHHSRIWEAVEEECDFNQMNLVFELETKFEEARFAYNLDVLGSEEDAFHYTFIMDTEDDPNWISQIPSSCVLQYIRETRSHEK